MLPETHMHADYLMFNRTASELLGHEGSVWASASVSVGAGVGGLSCNGSCHQPTSRQAPNFQPTAG
jgi:hypothetical protein